MWLDLNYDLLKKWQAVLLTSTIVVFGYNASVYLHPVNQDWIGSKYFSIANSIRFILIDQILIECITIFILFRLIRWYAGVSKLNQLQLNFRDLILYELKFLPILLTSFFVFGPVTMSVRFMLNHYNDMSADIYFQDYFYSLDTYVVYLMPVFLFGYGILNVNLIVLYNNQLGSTKRDLGKERRRKNKNRLWASDEWGEVFLDIENILWIERKGRKTLAQTDKDQFRLKENITELERKLDPEKFVQINRGVIVNLNHVQNYSFWENDKYILRMNGEKAMEFVMSRDRLNKIKHQLLSAADPV